MGMSLSKLRELVMDREAWLRFMGSQRVGHNWAAELNWTDWLTNHRLKIFSEKNSKKKTLDVEYTRNYLHSIYIVFTTINIAFTLYKVLKVI